MINEKFPGIDTYIIDAFVAAQRSKVTRKRMGSVLVGRRAGNVWHTIADACNGVDVGAEHKFEENGITLPHVYHAEQNIIAKLYDTRMDVDMDLTVFKDLVLIVMSSPCPMCANQIVKDIPNLTHVVYVEAYRDQKGVRILEENGIKCIHITPADVQLLIDKVNDVQYELTTAMNVGMKCLYALNRFIGYCKETEATTTSALMAVEKNELHAVFGMARIACAFKSDDQRRMLRYSLLSLGKQFDAVVNDVSNPNGIDKVFSLVITNKSGTPCCRLGVEIVGKQFMISLVNAGD